MTSQIETQEHLLTDCVEALSAVKDLIEEHLTGDEESAELASLKQVVKSFCEVDVQSKHNLNIVKSLINSFENEQVPSDADIDKMYSEKLQEGGDVNANYLQSFIWKQIFDQNTRMEATVMEVDNPEEEALNDSQFDEVDDDSLLCSNVWTPPVDPISKQVIQDPYKSKRCGHIYEYKFIIQYIKSMKTKAKCPFIGCNNKNLTAAQLKQDNECRKRIETYLATHKQSP